MLAEPCKRNCSKTMGNAWQQKCDSNPVKIWFLTIKIRTACKSELLREYLGDTTVFQKIRFCPWKYKKLNLYANVRRYATALTVAVLKYMVPINLSSKIAFEMATSNTPTRITSKFSSFPVLTIVLNEQ